MNLKWTATGDRKDDSIDNIPSLLNSLIGPRPVVLIGTQSDGDGNNLAIFNTFQPLGSSPPIFSVLIRPLDQSRHTYENMKTQKEWTVNFIRPEWVKAAHQTSQHLPKKESEFDSEVLIPEAKVGISAPFVKDAPIQMHFTWLREIAISENETRLVLGRLRELWTKVDLHLDQRLDFEKFPVLSSWGLSHYTHGKEVTAI